MPFNEKFADKNQINQAILTGAVAMLVFFLISLFMPKEWLVSGKVVVFPSGQPASASETLSAETFNTAEIIKSETFRKNFFADIDSNFSGAEVLKNSSMVEVAFRTSEDEIQKHEDAIVDVPSQVGEYTRDLYEGSPFKYKIAGDPEISARPVSPNLFLNAIFGFLIGVVLYFLYWRFVGFSNSLNESLEIESKDSPIVSPEIKPEEEGKVEQKIGKGKIEMIDGRPHFVPGKKNEAGTSAPENLPFVDEAASSPENIQEPSDEEVKERLNRLMRGEL